MFRPIIVKWWYFISKTGYIHSKKSPISKHVPKCGLIFYINTTKNVCFGQRVNLRKSPPAEYWAILYNTYSLARQIRTLFDALLGIVGGHYGIWLPPHFNWNFVRNSKMASDLGYLKNCSHGGQFSDIALLLSSPFVIQPWNFQNFSNFSSCQETSATTTIF